MFGPLSTGAVGLYYGARLLEAGHDVSFLARTDFAFLQRNGLTVESVDGDVCFDRVQVFDRAEDIGEVDWVVMALKSYALPSVKYARSIRLIAGKHSVYQSVCTMLPMT